MNHQVIDSPKSVRATLNYLVRTERKPYNYMYEPPSVPARFIEVNAVGDVLIRDARPIASLPSLDERGFVHRRHDRRVYNFYNEYELRRVYCLKIEALLKHETGAEKALIFDHAICSVSKFKGGVAGMREPLRRVHNDYTDITGRHRAVDRLDPAEAQERLKHRFIEVKVWRSIKGPLEDTPHAVLDARIVEPDDPIYRDKVGEAYAVGHNPEHRRFYFSRLQRDEVVLIKGFDSVTGRRWHFTPHTGFDDPATPATAPPSESIEVGALMFFRPDA